MKSPSSHELRQAGRRLHRAIGLICAGVCVLLVAGWGLPLIRMLLADEAGNWRQAASGLLTLVPGLCYLGALWQARPAFAALAKGELFGAGLVAALRTMGWALFAGAAFSLFLMAGLQNLLLGFGSYLHFSLADIALGLLGGVLALLARLLQRAAALQATLDGIV